MASKKVHRENPQDAFDDLDLDQNALPKDPRIDEIVNKQLYELGAHLTKPENRDRVPGAAVVIRKNKKVIHLNCYGYANLETGAKITPETVFDLGSLSKEFTALVILAMVDEEEIDKKDPISKFFSEFPSYADSVTVEDLLHHTSALPEYVKIYEKSKQVAKDWYDVAMEKSDGWYPQMAKKKAREITNKDVIQWFASQALRPGKPNTKLEYSNSGYVLLAELVERVNQIPFSEYLKTRFFDWMKMDNTYLFDENCNFAEDAPQIVNHARCYNGVKGTGFIPVGYTPLNFIYGDGNVHSTIVDLAKWDWHLDRLDYFGLVKKENFWRPAQVEKSSKRARESYRELLWEPAKIKNNKQVHYGAGWHLLRNKYEDDVEENGKPVTKTFESRTEYHRGVWLGWRGYFARGVRWVIPEDGKNIDPKTWESLGIIVLGNCSQVNTCLIAQQISQLYWGKWKKDNIMNNFNCE